MTTKRKIPLKLLNVLSLLSHVAMNCQFELIFDCCMGGTGFCQILKIEGKKKARSAKIKGQFKKSDAL
jgi:hypothetical protein